MTRRPFGSGDSITALCNTPSGRLLFTTIANDSPCGNSSSVTKGVSFASPAGNIGLFAAR